MPIVPNCEVCGSPIKSTPFLVEVEGAVMRTCSSCSRLGRPVLKPAKISVGRPLKSPSLPPPPALELRPDFSQLVKEARERLGLSQDELGQKMGEKPSVISLLERGRLRPSDALARKLEHTLKIGLLVPAEEF